MKIDPQNLPEHIRKINPHLFSGVCLPEIPDAVGKERDLHNEIIDICRQNGWIYFHSSTAHRTFRTLGEPDFTILLPQGKFLMVECKSKNGKLTEQQISIIAAAKKLMHHIHVVRSAKEFLELVDKKMKGEI